MTKDQSRWHATLREHGSILTREKPVSLHHVIGPSITERIGERGTRKRSDWLVLPLTPAQHVGWPASLHSGIETWQILWGKTEAELLDELGAAYGLDLWALAAQERMAKRAARRTKPAKPRPSKGSTASPSKMLPRLIKTA